MVLRFIIQTGLTVSAAVIMGAIAFAHEVQTAKDVGATLHIEPNDIVRAGAATEVWFALTQLGGQIVPLAACDCTLTLYDDQNVAIATPALSAISAEGFNNIPGATVIFPEVGAYELRLAGNSPTAQFAPFELRFGVTVASRAPEAAPTTAPEAASSTASEDAASPTADAAVDPSLETLNRPAASKLWKGGVIGVVGAIIVGLVIASIGGQRSRGDHK